MEEKKFRNEIKYACSQAQLALIENRIKGLCHLDPYAGADGVYLITSVYFDDYNDSCYYENENGVDPREKFRIRIYDRKMDYILLECKQKQSGKTHKKTCSISREQCMSILQSGRTIWKTTETPLLNKFLFQCRTRYLRPRVVVEYERTAYLYPQGNVRITFDRNITASAQTMRFAEADIRRPVMPTGFHILEVKYDELIPDYIYNAVGIENMRQTPFSKYYICRKMIKMG